MKNTTWLLLIIPLIAFGCKKEEKVDDGNREIIFTTDKTCKHTDMIKGITLPDCVTSKTLNLKKGDRLYWRVTSNCNGPSNEANLRIVSKSVLGEREIYNASRLVHDIDQTIE